MRSYFLIALLAINGLGYSQTIRRDTLSSTQPSTTLKGPKLTVAALYSSDINYYGQTGVKSLPVTMGYAGLHFRSGIYFSLTGYKLLNVGESFSGGGVTAGYDFNFSRTFTGGVSYTRSFYPDSSYLIQSENLNTFSGRLSYDLNWLNGGLTADLIPGEDEGFYLSLDIEKPIELIAFGKSAYLSLDPGVELIGSTQQIRSTERSLPSRAMEGVSGSSEFPTGLPDLWSTGP